MKISKNFLLFLGILELLIVFFSIKLIIDNPKETTILVVVYVILAFLFSINNFYKVWKLKKMMKMNMEYNLIFIYYKSAPTSALFLYNSLYILP